MAQAMLRSVRSNSILEVRMAAPSTLDPWREKGIPVDKQYRSWRQIVKEPVNKLEVDAYSCYARLPVGFSQVRAQGGEDSTVDQAFNA
jgi:hypothetical protein